MLEFDLRLFVIERLRQPHRRGDTVTRPSTALPRIDALPRIIVHTPAHADAALAAATETARAIILQSPPRCARIQGAPWFRKLVEAARARQPQAIALAVVDCADAPGLALGALRDGAEAVRAVRRR